ncbi:MAG: hypothetical protein HY841_05110 [Bacteroidetes bacterium]|nr:hypothetical protein [Bacteroidota bacterium]
MFEGRINKIIVFFIYISVFVNSYVFTKEPAEIYLGYLVFALLLPVFMLRHSFPKHLLAIFFILLVSGTINILLDNNTFPFFLKIYLGLFFSYLFYYYVVVQSEYNIEKLFQLYLIGCYIVSLIGVVQLVSYLVGFKYGYDYSWFLNKWGFIVGGNFGIRINSIFGEPTYFGTCVSAGMFVSIYNLIVKRPYYLSKFQSAVIAIIYCLTFSGVAYTAIFIAIILLLVNFGVIRYIFIFVPVLFGAFLYLYNNVYEFRTRYDSTVDIFLTGKFSIGKTHGSSIILYNNYRVALENVSHNFLFGTGLGSHPIAFDKYSITKNIDVHGFELNSADANSMLLRLISETGLFGTALMLIITFRCFIRRVRDGTRNIPEFYWIISSAILVMILINLFRQGHYFLNGFPFFIWMYYYNYVNYRKHLEEVKVKVNTESNTSQLSVL